MGNPFKKAWKKIKEVFSPKEPEIPEPESGDLVNKDASDASLPIIYGERKVGGTRVFVSTGTVSNGNKYLYICLAICEGEIESITDIQLNDIALATADSTAEDVTGDSVATINANTNKTLYQIFKGTDGQAASTLLTSAGDEWTSAHKLSGVAYLAFRFYWNADKFSSVPTITAIVKGRKVFDPSNNTTAWSDNPALCLRDYLTNTRYGKGLVAASAIDDTAFNAAVVDCNIDVESYTGGPLIPLLTCNAILKSSNTLFKNVKTLLDGMRGLMPYSNGQYALFIDRELPANYAYFDLTPDNILSDLKVVSTSKKRKFNRVKIKFTNPDTNWQPDFAIWPPAGSSEETAFLAADAGEVMSTETEMSSVTNYYRAVALAKIMCLNSRASTFNLSVTGLSECLEIAVGDVVRLEQPSMGWVDDGTDDARQFFRVTEIQIMEEGEVDLTLQQYDQNTYVWVSGAGYTPPPSTILPNPFAIGPPTSLGATAVAVLLSDGSLLPTIDVSWTAPVDAFAQFYDVQWKKPGDTAYKGAVSYGTSFQITDIIKGVVYNIRVRSVNAIGAKSTFETTTSTGIGDTTAPSIPTGLVVDSGVKNLTVRWVKPAESDYRDCEVYRSETETGTYEFIGNSVQSLTDESLDYGDTRYYKLKSVDHSGNQSAFSAVVSGSTASVGDSAFVGGVTGLFSGAGLQTIKNGNTLTSGLGTSDAGTLFYLTTDNKLYRWTGSAWTKAVPAVDVDGQLTTTQIGDNAITTGKILAGEITGGLLAASGVITATAQIDDAVVEAANIAYLTVDTLRIGANAAMVPLGASNALYNTVISANTWTGLSATGSVNWTQGQGSFTLKPTSITVIGSCNFLGVQGGSTDHTIELRVDAYWVSGGSVVGSTLTSVGGSIAGGNSTTLTLNHTFTPTDVQSGILFQILAKSTTFTKKIGNNGISVLASRR